MFHVFLLEFHGHTAVQEQFLIDSLRYFVIFYALKYIVRHFFTLFLHTRYIKEVVLDPLTNLILLLLQTFQLM